jgi:signal transduction histidine kinase
MAAMVAIAAAAVRPARRSAADPPRFGALAVTAAASAIALPIVVLWNPGDDFARLVIAGAVLVLGGVRLALSLSENMRLVSSARAAAVRQAALAELGRRALGGTDVETVMRESVRLAAESLGADYAAVLEAESRDVMRIVQGYGWPVVPNELVTGGSPAALASRSGEPVIVGDHLAETRFAQPELLRKLGARSGVSVVVQCRDRKRRVLGVQSRRPHALDATDAVYLEGIANVLATAIDRLHADAEVRALAAARGRLVVDTLQSEERERRRIAVGLHDDSLQEMLAARQELDDLDDANGRAGEYVANARSSLAQAARGVRETVADLHPVVLAHVGLQPALEALAKRQAARGGFEYDLAVDDEAARGRDEVIVSLARELLANVTKHAAASHVAVSVRPAGEGVRLVVEDDGTGIEPGALAAAPRGGHIGLASWTERVEALGGTMSVACTPGAGTRVTVELPPA